jgi:C-terminal processing protease CtpA/Prc
MRRVLSSICFTVALLCPWIAYAQIAQPSNCSVTSQNLWVRSQLNRVYYWNRFLPADVNPATFNSPEAYLEAVRYRPIDNSYSYIQSAAANDAFFNDSQFVGFGFRQLTTNTDIRVLQVYADSPALEAGLSRGDIITHVDGQSVSQLVANGTIGSAFGATEIGVAATIDFQKQSGEQRQARMVKRLVTIPTVSHTRIFEVDGRRVGFLLFANFVRPSIAALDEAFAAFKAADVNELVLDLRYNGGGLVDVGVHLGSLIGGSRTAGQPMLNYVHNNVIGPTEDRTTRFTSPEQALNLQRLFVLTTRSSASASELIINSLKAYMPVVVIGATTYGKPVGQYGYRFCEKILAPVAFSIRNANNEGDYFDGIAPTCEAGDDYLHELGDTNEASFAEALNYIRSGSCSVRGEATSRVFRALTHLVPRPTGWASVINSQ